MSEHRFHASIEDCLAALRKDLVHEQGPRISPMRNYRFAIVPYLPKLEFKLREKLHSLTTELQAHGWVVHSVSLKRALIKRLRSLGEHDLERLVANEKRLFKKNPARGLKYLSGKIAELIEGPNGLSAEVQNDIATFADAHPDKAERMVVFVGQGGSLYPFFRTSALLKHLDGHTRNIPVVLLYPGKRTDKTLLSFMGRVPPDGDYRPRIYP